MERRGPPPRQGLRGDPQDTDRDKILTAEDAKDNGIIDTVWSTGSSPAQTGRRLPLLLQFAISTAHPQHRDDSFPRPPPTRRARRWKLGEPEWSRLRRGVRAHRFGLYYHRLANAGARWRSLGARVAFAQQLTPTATISGVPGATANAWRALSARFLVPSTVPEPAAHAFHAPTNSPRLVLRRDVFHSITSAPAPSITSHASADATATRPRRLSLNRSAIFRSSSSAAPYWPTAARRRRSPPADLVGARHGGSTLRRITRRPLPGQSRAPRTLDRAW